MITNFKIFEANNKKYIITTYNYDQVFTLNQENDSYSYELNNVNTNHKLKFFTSYKDATEFINFLQKTYDTYRKYKFKVIPYDKFEILLNMKKYNL